eukprot:CAMPEP_0179095980 /NCGR_PEP_ID=MMETSP0796-20121207/44094_1 /TAXON_ID=73915 /ORGANISM="Pyrodinium bahamense, Strain pbaha01" /LENGTH=92 /DNA_ID=CAMNT_0020793677 /DNA_START=377 /DNA_END=651 /DNA_ORIENTATION=+
MALIACSVKPPKPRSVGEPEIGGHRAIRVVDHWALLRVHCDPLVATIDLDLHFGDAREILAIQLPRHHKGILGEGVPGGVPAPNSHGRGPLR